MNERLNNWRSLIFHDPAHVLREFRKLELSLPPGVDPIVAQLRTPGLKEHREGREAALFTYGMSLASGKDIRFAHTEAEDYDFVTCWKDGDTANFTPVQLKELVSAERNPSASLPDLLASLALKYPTPSSTVLAVYLNRGAKVDELMAVRVPSMGFAEVWYFCCVSPDAERWAIFGDAKTQLKQLVFDYPRG